MRTFPSRETLAFVSLTCPRNHPPPATSTAHSCPGALCPRRLRGLAQLSRCRQADPPRPPPTWEGEPGCSVELVGVGGRAGSGSELLGSLLLRLRAKRSWWAARQCLPLPLTPRPGPQPFMYGDYIAYDCWLGKVYDLKNQIILKLSNGARYTAPP